MSRAIWVAALAAMLLLPATGAYAQKEPPRTKELKEAEKFIASAILSSDTAEKKSRLERALNPLQQAMAKDPDNARVWFAAGQVYAGLRDYVRADSAFDKAEALYAPLATEINDERIRAWADAFNRSNVLMDAQNYPPAIELLKQAELIYAGRPESKINLGAIYASQNELANAEAAFRSVIELVKATPAGKITAEDAPNWKRYNELAIVNTAQMVGQRGITAFEAQKYDDAMVAFREALALNARSRDFSYNLAQSLYAKARDLEEKLADAKGAEAKQIGTELTQLYTDLEPLVEQARQVDPNNEDLYLLLMRSYKIRGDLATGAAAKANYTKRASDLLKLHQALEAEVAQLAVGASAPGEGTIKGTLRNIKLAPGTPVRIKVTLMALDGTTVGEQEVTVNAPAADQTVPFETKVKLTGDIAAWKYELLK